MKRNPYRKHPSRGYNDQTNMAEFAEEHQTLRPSSRNATSFPPSLNGIPKKITE
ncbi:MAG TPA: hypothetical protein VEZ72_21865 [Paenibacillus sp.]|nr:hypothetical protein [Paenibacillus sp.]